MLKKIKVSEIFTYDVIEDGIGLFENLDLKLKTFLNSYIGLTEEDYNKSPLHNLLNSNKTEFDEDYFIENSSEKYLTRYIQLLIDKIGLEHLDEIVEKIAEHVITKFGFKWWKISEAITTDYRPLENYDMEEIRTPNLREELTRKQATDTNVHQETESGVYGFNSTESNPTATGEGDTHTTGLKANNETEDVKSNTGTESLTRHGNIGVTTSQQMLESEIKLRQYNFIEEVFKDIDSILCLKVY